MLRLTPDSQQLQINELDRCWQNDMPFNSWIEVYQERMNIAKAVVHVKTLENQCAHFLQRVNVDVHRHAVL